MPGQQENFPKGSAVRIASRPELQRFKEEWTYHDKLTDEQLDYAGVLATVKDVGFGRLRDACKIIPSASQ